MSKWGNFSCWKHMWKHKMVFWTKKSISSTTFCSGRVCFRKECLRLINFFFIIIFPLARMEVLSLLKLSHIWNCQVVADTTQEKLFITLVVAPEYKVAQFWEQSSANFYDLQHSNCNASPPVQDPLLDVFSLKVGEDHHYDHEISSCWVTLSQILASVVPIRIIPSSKFVKLSSVAIT